MARFSGATPKYEVVLSVFLAYTVHYLASRKNTFERTDKVVYNQASLGAVGINQRDGKSN